MIIGCPGCQTRLRIQESGETLHASGTAVEYRCPRCTGRLVFAWPHFRTLAEADAQRRKGAA